MPMASQDRTRVRIIAAVAGGLVIVLYVSAYFLIGIRRGLSLVEVFRALGPDDCGFLLTPIVPILFTVGMLFVPEQGRVARALSWALYGLSLAFPATVAIFIHQFRDCGMALGMSYLIACISLGAPAALLLIGWVGARFIFEKPSCGGEGRMPRASRSFGPVQH